MLSLLLALCAPTVQAGAYDALFTAAADEFDVPEPLLLALAYEASRFDPDAASAWGGYGLFDLREDDESFGPGLERVSTLLDQSPDAVRASPALQVRGAAALLAWHARNLRGDGTLPPVDALEDWAGALRGFSGREEDHLQDLFVAYVYEVVEQGFLLDEAELVPRAVDLDLVRLAAPPSPAGDYSGNYQYVPASTSNYSDYSRGASDISYVVIHTVQGSYSGCISWFQNPSASVSAHYVVRSSDGQVTQMVLEEDVGWHAGSWSYNLASVGIEHEGYVDDPGKWYTTAMYTGSAALTANIAARQGVSLDRSHIIAHSEVPGATHTDPGSGWDWDTYMGLVDGSGGSTTTARLIGKVADTDIYTGTPLAGATVVLDQTGETTTTSDTGTYSFDALSAGSWSVTVSYPGYNNGSCAKDITTSSGDWWCSVAMTLSSGGGGDDSGEDSGQDSQPADDSAEPEDSDPERGGPLGGGTVPARPGDPVPMDQLGCSTAAGGAGAWALWALAALGLTRRSARRRRA